MFYHFLYDFVSMSIANNRVLFTQRKPTPKVGTALYITTLGRTRYLGPMASKRYNARCQVLGPMVLMQALKTKALEDDSLKGLPGGVEKQKKWLNINKSLKLEWVIIWFLKYWFEMIYIKKTCIGQSIPFYTYYYTMYIYIYRIIKYGFVICIRRSSNISLENGLHPRSSWI